MQSYRRTPKSRMLGDSIASLHSAYECPVPEISICFVEIKMGRRQGGPSRTGGRGRVSKSIRNRRATQPPAHFHRNPLGRGQLAVFPRCSLLTYRFRYARRSRLEKKPTDLRRKTCVFRGQDTRIGPGLLLCRPELAPVGNL